MATIRRAGFGSVFEVENETVGIGTTGTATNTVQVLGETKASLASVSGLSTLTTYQGFVNSNAEFGNSNVDINSQSGSIGNIEICHGDFNVSSASTLTSSINQLTITNSFSVPTGNTDSRIHCQTAGSMRFNEDLGTLEFYTGEEWKTVNSYRDNSRGRGLFGGGQPGTSSQIDSIEIMSLGNAVEFGNLISGTANRAGYGNNIRGIFAGGAGPTVDEMDYVTIASRGNGIDFGNLTDARGYLGGACSSTRGLMIGGWAGSNPPSNIIDYVEIMTIGNAADFGDLFTGRYNHSSFSSPTRAFAYSGVNNNDGTQEASIEMITIASKGNGTDFGDAATAASATLCGSSSQTRGIMGGGYAGPTYLGLIQYVTMSSSGSAQIFGDLTIARQRSGGASTQTRSVFYAGYDGSNVVNTIDYVTIATTGNALDFGDAADEGNYAKGGLSDSHGGLGGF